MNIEPIGYNDILRKMDRHLKADGSPGRNTGFYCLNDYYTVKQAGVTDWTGYPGSGKTYFVLELLFGEAEMYGKRFGLYVPDLGSEEDIFEKLIKMRTGKDFTNKYYNKIDEAEIVQAMTWISRHFIVFRRKDFKKGVVPEDVWQTTCEYMDDFGYLDGVLVDSWKNFNHLYSGREDQYLDLQLSMRNEYAEKYNKHFHTIAHAVKIDQFKGGKSNERRVPNANDIKGGGAWYANGKNIITVDFPDRSKFGVNLHISKVKPENVGKTGSIIDKIFLDVRKGRYFEYINGKPCYSGEYRNIEIPTQSEMDFDYVPSESPSPF